MIFLISSMSKKATAANPTPVINPAADNLEVKNNEEQQNEDIV